MWLFVPSSTVTRVHTSTSGPYGVLERQAVQVVVAVQASWFEDTCRPFSTPPFTAFVQSRPSESGFSFGRLKSSSGTSGSAGTTSPVGVACVPLESGPSPTAFSADTL